MFFGVVTVDVSSSTSSVSPPRSDTTTSSDNPSAFRRAASSASCRSASSSRVGTHRLRSNARRRFSMLSCACFSRRGQETSASATDFASCAFCRCRPYTFQAGIIVVVVFGKVVSSSTKMLCCARYGRSWSSFTQNIGYFIARRHSRPHGGAQGKAPESAL